MTELSEKRRELEEILGRIRRRAIRVHGGAAFFSWLACALLLLALAALALRLGMGGWVRLAAPSAILGTGLFALYHTFRKALSLGPKELAQALEERVPEARGLVSALELADRLDDPTFPYSGELTKAHVTETGTRTGRLSVEGAFDSRPLLRGRRMAFAGGAIFLGTLAMLPSSFGKLVGMTPAQKEVARRATPITGDVSLTYLYPRYAGLEQRTVEGTAGAIEALRGTEVRIETRADRLVGKAFLEVGEASLPMEVEGGRLLRGAVQVQESGTYAFRFEDERGRVLVKGPPIPITVVEDAAPTISLDAPVPELVVTERDSVELRYEAVDDFGIGKVELVFQVGPTDEQRKSVASFGDPRRRTGGSYTWELAPLGLRPGETVTYYLRAQDNDAVSGEKWGQSRSQTLKVFSAAEHRRELIAKVEEAWEQMILGLGDRIEPREGPRKVQGEARVEAGRRADAQVLSATGLLQDVAAELSKEEEAPIELFAAVQNLARNLGRKSQHTRATRARSPTVHQGRDRYLHQLESVEADEQAELERGVLYLESLLDRQRLQEIEELSRELADSRRELANLIESYQEAPGEEAQREILRELGRLRQRIQDLMQRMAELGKGIQDEHLNLEAQKAMAQERDLLGQLDEVEKMVSDGDLEGALAELQKLAMQMDKLTQALGDAADGQVENDPALQQLAEDLERFDEELASLERQQQKLTQDTEKLRGEQSKKLQEQLAAGGKDLIEELRKKVSQAQGSLGAMQESRLPRTSSDDFRATLERLEDLDHSLLAKDFDAALESAAASLAYALSLELGLDRERGYAERFGIGSVEELDTWLDSSRRATPLVREVKEKLEQLFANPNRQMSEQQKKQLEALAEQQADLGERMQGLRDQAEKIGEQAPIFDDASMGSMDEARQSMHEAAGKLRSKQPGGALASERRAQEHLDTLRQGLEDAKQQAKSQGGGSGFPMPLGGGSGGRRGGGSRGFDAKEKVEIPNADQYEAPEAYRKEILDAMKKKAPEGFQEPVRDYYQEIVK